MAGITETVDIDGVVRLNPDSTAAGSARLQPELAAQYSSHRRAFYLLAATVAGVIIAGFWNFRLVDGFGADIVAANTIGDYRGKAAEFAILGATFGFVFAFVAGLAATFTACNCVAFAMIHGLVCAPGAKAGRRPRSRLLRGSA